MLGLGALTLAGCTTTPMAGADTPEKRQEIDSAVNSTMNKLYSTVRHSRELVDKAHGVLVFPSVLAAGFFVGGEYGEGALRVGCKTQGYYSTATGSLGLQIGAQSKAIIFLFMTQAALDKFRNSQGWTAGADASVMQALLIATTLMQLTGPLWALWPLQRIAHECPDDDRSTRNGT